MKTIYKYPLPVTDEFEVLLPVGARILTVQVQNDTPCLWAEVDAEQTVMASHAFNLFGTGHPVPAAPGTYLGTFQLREGRLVFHLYESMLRGG